MNFYMDRQTVWVDILKPKSKQHMQREISGKRVLCIVECISLDVWYSGENGEMVSVRVTHALGEGKLRRLWVNAEYVHENEVD